MLWNSYVMRPILCGCQAQMATLLPGLFVTEMLK